MRRLSLIVMLAVFVLACPAALFAGDQIHHGHGMKSSWDTQTGDGYQGSEYVGRVPDLVRPWSRNHYAYGCWPQYPEYGYSGLSVTYNDGNWGASFNYRSPYYGSRACFPVCGNYSCSGYCPTCTAYYYPAQYRSQYYAPLQPAYTYASPQYQRYPSVPIYSAPANPDLGYYAQPAQNYQQQPQVVNIYNYYGDEFSSQNSSNRPTQQQQAEQPPIVQNYQQQENYQQAPADRLMEDAPVGTLFYSTAFLNTARDGMHFTLDNTTLLAGPENGPPQVVAGGVDGTAGVLASYQPQVGYSLIYRVGDAIIASRQTVDGWFEEPLPEFVDFSRDVTLGMVGGSPWVVFTGFDGGRHIFTWSGGWQKLGSGSPSSDSQDSQ